MAKKFITKEEYIELLKLVHELANHSIEVAKTTKSRFQQDKFTEITEQLEKMIKRYDRVW